MSILTMLSRMASDYRTRRMRAWTDNHLANLPHEIQKDIGWPAGAWRDMEPRRKASK